MKTYMTLLFRYSVVCLALAIVTPSASAQQVHRKLPNTVENRKPAIPHKPFTIEDFRKVRADITSTTTVRLRNGTVLPVAKYLAEVNKVEKLLNGYGYTLRKLRNQKQLIVLDETRIRIRGNESLRTTPGQGPALLPLPTTAIPSLEGPLQQFTPNEAVWTVLDPAVFGAQLVWKTSSTNKLTTIETTDELVLKGWAFNDSTNLLTASASANVPAGLAPNDPERAAKVHFDILGLLVKDTSDVDSGENAAFAPYSTTRKSFNSPSLQYPTFIGPIPIVLKIGFQVYGAATMSSRAEVYSSVDDIASAGGVAVNARALADLAIIGAGLEVSIDALSFTYNYTNKSSLTRMPLPTTTVPSPSWDWTSVKWQYGKGYRIESGSGRMSVVIEVDLWALGSVSLAKDIVTWDGYIWDAPYVESSAQVLTRPAGCGEPRFKDAMCTIPASAANCVSLSTDKNNCGGCGVLCPSGTNCELGECKRPETPPTGHVCLSGTQCCEPAPTGNKCLGVCVGPGQKCP